MSRHFTVQCSYSSHHANTVTVEADTLEEALEKAIEAANEDPDGWRSTDHVTDSFIDAVCQAPIATHGARARCRSPTISRSAASRRW